MYFYSKYTIENNITSRHSVTNIVSKRRLL